MNKPQQKQPLPFKNIQRNIYNDKVRQSLSSTYNTEQPHICDCKPPGTCEDGSCLNRMMFTECSLNCVCGMCFKIVY